MAPNDALAVINFINAFGSGPVPINAIPGVPYIDANRDGHVAPNDALAIINFINAGGIGEGAGESVADARLAARWRSMPRLLLRPRIHLAVLMILSRCSAADSAEAAEHRRRMGY